jgi:hypothetical protein
MAAVTPFGAGSAPACRVVGRALAGLRGLRKPAFAAAWAVVGLVGVAGLPLPAGAAEVSATVLQGRWAGQMQGPNGTSWSWIAERRADGRQTVDLELAGELPAAQRSRLSGRWALDAAGMFEWQPAGPTGGLLAARRWRVAAAERGCMRFTPLDDAAEPHAGRAYTECPVPLPPLGSSAPRTCTAQLPAPGGAAPQRLAVRLEPAPAPAPPGWVRAFVDGEEVSGGVAASDHPVHPDALRRSLDALNLGEQVLRAAVDAAAEPMLAGLPRLPFDARRVRWVRVFVIDPGSGSKFGGVTLFDAFAADGQLLGTVLHALVPLACVPGG